jgi:hypothetical protein
VDGVNYDLLSEDEFDEITEVPAGTYYWLYRPKSYNDTSDPNPATVHTDGWRLAKTVPDRVFNVLDNLGSVTIANGAELEFEGEDAPEISKLKLDVNAQGSIKGFAFAAEGCLEIAGELPKEGATISLDLNEAENAANLSSWSVKVNGEITGKKLRAGKNGLEVYNRGLILKVL